MINNLSENYIKKTKIIATVGPSLINGINDVKQLKLKSFSNQVNIASNNIEQAIKSGVNCFRLNFSHGNQNEHLAKIEIIRSVAHKMDVNVAIMLDTKGPEIRISKLKKDSYIVKENQIVCISTKKNIIGDNNSFSVSDATKTYNMANDVKPNSIILISDGKLTLKVIDVDANKGIIKTVALNTYSISQGKRINLPDTQYSLPFMSEVDYNDILFACKHNVDYIAASFCNSAKDVKQIRNILIKSNRPNIQIIAKIESSHAIKNLNEIIKASDGIMVARGDLGLEIPYYDVPYWEKQMIRRCRFNGKPVIVATQMLDSLESNILPTRAEVTDVFFAVDRGADATMLSGETANGKYPLSAINIMSNIDIKSEHLFDYERSINFYFKKTNFKQKIKTEIKKLANKIKPTNELVEQKFPYSFIALFSNDMEKIKALSNIRPGAPIFLFTSTKELIRYFSIYYGVQTFFVKNINISKTEKVQLINKIINKIKIKVNKYITLN